MAGKGKGLGRPNIKKADSIDAILGVDGQSAGETMLELDMLTPFDGHPFYLYDGERLEDLVESIKEHGVIQPIIVRPQGKGKYEIISGHNRVIASREAGLDEIPAKVIEGLSDETALAYVVETNLMQRSFTDMKHSEKAAVLSLHHSKMFSQGKRNDILAELDAITGIVREEIKDDDSGDAPEKGKKTREIVADTYGLSPSNVSRYLRVQHLIPALKTMLDDESLGFLSGVALSFIPEDEQGMIADCIDRNGLKVDGKKAALLRAESESGVLDKESVYKILADIDKESKLRVPSVKIDPNIFSLYFKPDQKKKEVEETIEKALQFYFENSPDANDTSSTDEDDKLPY